MLQQCPFGRFLVHPPASIAFTVVTMVGEMTPLSVTSLTPLCRWASLWFTVVVSLGLVPFIRLTALTTLLHTPIIFSR